MSNGQNYLPSSAPDVAPVALTCFRLHGPQLRIVPAPVTRPWMDRVPNQFAYRCLPLNIANSHGWLLLNDVDVEAVWNGGPTIDDVTVRPVRQGDDPPGASSHFGSGVLTFSIAGLFQTSPGYDLWVCGPTNAPKDGIAPLTGLVETDWLPFTFTMNWLFTRPHHPVVFARDEPVAMIFPVPRGLVERVEPSFRDIGEEPALAAAYTDWSTSRDLFNHKLKQGDPDTRRQGWQKNYVVGRGPFAEAPADHRTKVRPPPFPSSVPATPVFPDEAAASPPGRKSDRGPKPGRSPGVFVVDDFLPLERALALRAAIDAHFANQRALIPANQIWNYWYVPSLYTYLRTLPEHLFGQAEMDAFRDRLRAWSFQTLGLANVGPSILSLYVNGCYQGLHNDSGNGRLAYVYSLTRDDRRSTGGVTQVLREGDPFRRMLAEPGYGPNFYEEIEPRFNRLILFDDRLPHAVRAVEGAMDPLEGRFVLHGHISEGGFSAEGALGAEQAAPPVADALGAFAADVGGAVDGLHGPFVARLNVGPAGEVDTSDILFDRVFHRDGDEARWDEIRVHLLRRLRDLRFPAASGGTTITQPLRLGARPRPQGR